MRRTRLGILALVGVGCGTATAPSRSEPESPPITFPAIRAALTIDPDALPNYATPALPAFYAGLIGGTTDNGRNAPVTNAGATLGRVLFYDKQLSLDGTVACATCHASTEGFSDADQFSQGIDALLRTGFHAMRLANARFYAPGQFFWDRRAATLEAQVIQPIQHPVEMGFDAAHGGLDSLVRRLRTRAYYAELFQLAFGDGDITAARLQLALAQYVRSIVSAGSRWDQGYAQTFNPAAPDRGVNAPIPSFTPQENRGRQLFFQPPPQGGAGCAGCHVAPTFALVGNSLSNGLDAGETGIFKSPSLKNVGLGGPYMHDGRFQTLEQVVAFYNGEVQNGPALDRRLRAPGGGPPIRLNLPPGDQAALVAFLRTLDDPAVLSDPRFANPFR